MGKPKTTKKVSKPKAEKKIGAVKTAQAAGENEYALYVKIGDDVYETTNVNLAEAFISLKPKKLTNKTIIRVTYNGKVVERAVPPRLIRRVFSNKLTALVYAKNIIILLK